MKKIIIKIIITDSVCEAGTQPRRREFLFETFEKANLFMEGAESVNEFGRFQISMEDAELK